jgi:tetratricopeptide (TPR) repeat protein
MSRPTEEEIARMAQEALEGKDPEKTRETLLALVEASGDRPDLLHALAATEVSLGQSTQALNHILRAERLLEDLPDSQPMLAALMHTRAACYEDLEQPQRAAETYRKILTLSGSHARALQALGHLLLSWGRPDEGVAQLAAYLDDGTDSADHLEGTAAYLRAVRRVLADQVHPTMFLEAHREGYCRFFDHHADEMAKEGWVAEAARMTRNDDGEIVPSIEEDSPSYAAVRVDLVDPSSGQQGQVGERPMVVALQDYEAVAQAPLLLEWPPGEHPFSLWVSTQCPWDHMPILVRFSDPDCDAVEAFEPVLASWYMSGWDGTFGESEKGRFHEVVPPIAAGAGGAVAYVDLGRAELRGIEDLRKRLTELHKTRPIRAVLLGRGFVPG